MRRISIAVVSVIVVLGLATGCQPRRNSYGSQGQQESYLLHEIRFPGETMGLIANWYTGSTDNYTVIASANPNVDLNRMRIGDVIRIPERLIVRREELPARVVRNAPKSAEHREAQQTATIAPTQPAREETPLADQIARESGDLDLPNSAVVPVEPQPTEPSIAPPPTQPEGGRRDVRIKTRDELLEELLK